MSRTRLLIVVAVLALVAGVAFFYSKGGPKDAIDLVALFADPSKAERKTNHDNAFATETVTIAGEAKASIVARPSSRIIYTVKIPPDAWLETSFALKPEVWQQPTDGVQFRIGISEGRTYDELLRQVVVPSRGDTRWLTARLDLSAYAGRTVKLIFNTDPGPPGATSVEFDEAVWGAPHIFSRK